LYTGNLKHIGLKEQGIEQELHIFTLKSATLCKYSKHIQPTYSVSKNQICKFTIVKKYVEKCSNQKYMQSW